MPLTASLTTAISSLITAGGAGSNSKLVRVDNLDGTNEVYVYSNGNTTPRNRIGPGETCYVANAGGVNVSVEASAVANTASVRFGVEIQ